MAKPSQITFGTMRMHEVDRSARQWADFLAEVHMRGVQTVHSSDEYDSYPLFCEALAIFRESNPGLQFRHVVKLAEPSFDDSGFDSTRLAARLEAYRHSLSADVINDVQWMWRKDLKDEGRRLKDGRSALAQIGDAASRLKADGKMDRFLCFPYTHGFADLMLETEFLDGFVIYRNANEREFDHLLDPCGANGKTCLIIRPFSAGATLNSDSDPADQLAAALDHPAIESAILSTSSLAHLDQLLN